MTLPSTRWADGQSPINLAADGRLSWEEEVNHALAGNACTNGLQTDGANSERNTPTKQNAYCEYETHLDHGRGSDYGLLRPPRGLHRCLSPWALEVR